MREAGALGGQGDSVEVLRRALGARICGEPGQTLRVGIGANVGYSWNHLAGMLPACLLVNPPRNGGGNQYLGGAVEVEHDVGQPGRFSMRYGAGVGVMNYGCTSSVLPAPTVALRYTF